MPTSNRKQPGSKEIHVWADPDLHQRLTDICKVMPMNMADLVESLIRNHLSIVERNVWSRYDKPRRP